MGSKDPRIDAYIAKAAPFAQPILEQLRAQVHAACPEAEETMKWSMPHFMYRDRILCGMSAFKQHASFGFWQGRQVVGEKASDERAMGQFGRITSLAELPRKARLARYIKQAMRLTEQGTPAPRAERRERKAPAPVPADLAKGLAANRKAKATFEGFAPSHRREYIEWIEDAKREETRARRLEQAIEWLAEGKQRHWKYQNC